MSALERYDLDKPVKKQVGGDLANVDVFRRIEMLQKNADSVFGPNWRGKDDGTLVRKVVGASGGSRD